jgi:hypothetical protein
MFCGPAEVISQQMGPQIENLRKSANIKKYLSPQICPTLVLCASDDEAVAEF